MGVRGLTGLIEDNSSIYRDYPFRGRRLVIDGSNLLCLLYNNSGSGLEQNHGGEYAAFEKLIENFITALRTCNISPYVVLDGGRDVSGKKLKTLAERAQDRIHRAHRAAVEGSQENILPPLSRLVFKQTLERLEVPMAICDEEADQEIAALAEEWECPVLSSDSDFYIFHVKSGMLPLSHFQWRALKQRHSQSFIPCKIYRTSSFCIFFGIQERLLPTFAALAGNDFVKLNLPYWTQFSPTHVQKQRRLWGLLYWLRRFHSSEEAVVAILEQMTGLNEEQQRNVRESLHLGTKEYQLSTSRLKKFFIDKTLPPFPEAAGVVPHWIQLCVVRGEMTSCILDVLRLRSRSLSPCVGSATLYDSAHQTSKPLRQVMYGLLSPHRQLDPPMEVVERDRVGLNLTESRVQAVIHAAIMDLPLASLPAADHRQRLQVLLEALEVEEDYLSRLPTQLHLPVAVTCYWWQKARPTPDVQLLKALLLGLSVGASQTPEAALLFSRTKFDLTSPMAHNVNQWLSCIKHCIYLSQLLRHPFPQPHISTLYEGALVYHLIDRMMSGKLKNFLKNDLSRIQTYKTMFGVVRQFDCLKPRRRRKFHQGNPAPVEETVVDLRKLFDQEEEAAAARALEDVHLSHRVWLKSRHTAKDKRKLNSNLVMVFKSERRWKDLI